MNENTETLQQMYAQRMRETEAESLLPLDSPEAQKLAAQQRKTFDLPTNAVKVDPKRW